MTDHPLFTILPSVESTNNYAMGIVREDSGKHGAAWFTPDQTAGRGQRGKSWKSSPNNNIALSILIKPKAFLQRNPFILSAMVAHALHQFLSIQVAEKPFFIKWPNDIYCNDRKAAGILIENVFRDKVWEWAVIGIGINVNEDYAQSQELRAISMKEIDEVDRNPEQLARALHKALLQELTDLESNGEEAVVANYNEHLYKKGEKVKLRAGNKSFVTTIKQVSQYGDLITDDSMQQQFSFGTVEWVFG